ncbi:MAG: hypothetical protein M0024_13590 [Nitrospiraceae bacterium]|nr:hypothetical protein [Nitrospiraceae bacterium]
MPLRKFDRLVRKRLLTPTELEAIGYEAHVSGENPGELLIKKGIPRHEIIFCLSEYYNLPVIEYDEGTVIARSIVLGMDMERLKQALWVPMSFDRQRAEVIACAPEDPAVIEDIRRTLGVARIDFLVTLPADLVRIIENSQDLNPGFPPPAGRTPLAKVRTFLADRRSLFACNRTSLAKGRTGLAFLRTGISFIAIAAALFRVFGFGFLGLLEIALMSAGILSTVDGILWYIPARKAGKRLFPCACTESTWGTTVMTVSNPGDNPVFMRTDPVEGATGLRERWRDLSPVMRRRFLASDRTDMAEERTTLACYRTIMARARTGLAFTRTGIAFIGLGTAFLRQFGSGSWVIFDSTLICLGILMTMEGFYWYAPGRHAGVKGYDSVRKVEEKPRIWDFIFPPSRLGVEEYMKPPELPVKPSYSPGIWATTGVALERTVLADRRNVMARLRTLMARSRTGMAFIRTGMSISSVGFGLLVYFGAGRPAWTVFYTTLILAGLVLIADGLYWRIPAERIKRQFPYCFGEMEITVPDYGRPARAWKKAVFSSAGD